MHQVAQCANKDHNYGPLAFQVSKLSTWPPWPSFVRIKKGLPSKCIQALVVFGKEDQEV